jgi:hypothetical protein
VRMTLLAVAPVVLASLALPALGQGEDAPAEPIRPVEAPWVLKFEPAAWYVATSGSVRLPGSASAGNGESFEVADLNVDSPRVSPLGELQLRRGDWRIGIGGLGVSTDDRGAAQATAGQIGDVTFAAGDTLRSEVDLHTFAADGGYALHTFRSGVLDGGGDKFRSTVLALAGIRAISAEITSQVFASGVGGAIASGDAFGAHPYAGVRWEMDIYEEFSIDVVGTLGGVKLGDSESWSSDIMVGFQWNPTANFGAQIGYRQLLFGVETDDAPAEFAWQGGLAGVYAGAVVRF